MRACWLLGFAILWALYIAYHQWVALSSDSTTMLPVAADLVSGNVLLRGWTLGSANFLFTETIFHALGLALGLSYQTLMAVIPTLFFALLVVTMIYVFVFRADARDGISGRGRFFITAGYLALVGTVATSAAYTFLNANSHNNLYFWAILAWLLVTRHLDNGKLPALVGYVALATLLAYSESVTYMVLFAPVGLYCVHAWWRGPREERRRQVLVVLATGLSFVLAKGIDLVVERSGGLSSRGLPVGLIAPGDVMDRLAAYLPQAMVLFGYGSGYDSSARGLGALYNAVILLVLAGLLATLIHATVRFGSLARADQLLYLVTVVNLLACLLTDTEIFHRYLAPAFLFGVMLLLRTCWRVFAHRRVLLDRRLAIGAQALALVAIAVVIGFRMHVILQSPPVGAAEAGVARELAQRGYRGGYGDFWCSSVVSYYTGFTIPIYPVLVNGNGVQNWPELIKDDWYREDDKHFVITRADGSSTFIDNNELFARVGPPTDSFTYANYQVFYWDEDISGFVGAYR